MVLPIIIFEKNNRFGRFEGFRFNPLTPKAVGATLWRTEVLRAAGPPNPQSPRPAEVHSYSLLIRDFDNAVPTVQSVSPLAHFRRDGLTAHKRDRSHGYSTALQTRV